MIIGMLWFDDNPSVSLGDKVARAAAFYASKYGCKPNVCFINPGMMRKDVKGKTRGIEIKTSRTILRHHFWLGVQQPTLTDS